MGGAACKPIVDTGIYTRNRVFRIVGSTKYGKALGRLKLVDTGIKWGDNFWKEHGIEGRSDASAVRVAQWILQHVCLAEAISV